MSKKSKEQLAKDIKGFQELYGVSDDEMRLFEYLYRKECIYRYVIVNLILVIILLVLLLQR